MEIIERWTEVYRGREYEVVKYSDGSLAFLLDGRQFTRRGELWQHVRDGEEGEE